MVRFALVYGFVLAIAIAATIIVTWAFTVRDNVIDDLEQTWRPAQADAAALLTAVLDQETGQRGYLLTGQESFLTPYVDGGTRSDELVGDLQRLSSDDVDLRAAVDATDKSVDNWRQNVAEPEIALARVDPEAARESVATGEGRRLFDEFRSRHQLLVDEIDERVSDVERRHERSVRLIQLGVAIGASVLIAAALFALRRARAWTTQRDELLQAERELREEKELTAQRLQESTTLFRGVTNTSAVGIAVFDSKRRFIDINESLASRNGLTQAFHIGRTPAELFDDDVATSINDMIDTALAGTALADVPVTGVDNATGELTDLLVSYFPIVTSDGTTLAVGCNVVDVTELTQVNGSLQRTRSRLRTLIDRLQESLLPARLPEIEAFELAVEYRSAGADTEIGGDFYDVTPSLGDDIAVTVGDVCGHDIEAATSTGIVRHTIAAASQHLHDPSEVVRWANDALLARVDDHRFVTVAHAHLARRPGGGAICSLVLAGHPPPLLIPGDGSAVREIGQPGTVLGTMQPLRLTTVVVALDAGDRLVFFTDGLFENPDPRLDLSDLLALVGGCGRDGADRLLRDLMDRYDDLTIRPDVDDVAVLVIGVR